MGQFHVATLKLTAWYLAILMAVSVAFSVVIYQITAHELDRPFPPGGFNRSYELNEAIRIAREARAIEGKQNLIVNLTVLNIATLALGAAASYFFARRTLRPIEEAMEAQSRFVSDASHELRTPLAVMRTENEIALREKRSTTKNLRSVIASNLEETERLQLLTDRLLALSSEQELPLSSFVISPVLHDALSRHEAAAAHKHIALKTKISDLSVTAHPETVSDIVSILIDNAIKYSPANTNVKVVAREQGRKVIVTVSDEGSGISEDDLPHLFDRFYRADQSRSKSKVEGHGLGLALAKRLADLNHATLTADNRQQGGAVFTLELDKA